MGAEDILHTGKDAFHAALNTVNVGKFNLGFASIGICEHAFYEAITHADGRILYGHKVTEFPHVRQLMTDAYARLVAMKLFSDRAIDYFRSAGPDDRRYLLFNPITKMKVTTEGEKVIDDLWDVIAAKGFEKDTFFEMAARDIRGLPKLEGTVHVNMALVLKFMANYLFNPAEYPPVPQRRDAADDEFLFRQGPAQGPRKDPVQRLARGVRAVRRRPERRPLHGAGRGPRHAARAPRRQSRSSRRELGFLLTLGELFTLVAYGQLILEQAALTGVDADTIDAIFDVLVRDFSELRRHAARPLVVDRGPAGMGARPRAQAGRRHRALRAGLGRGRAARGRLRDAPVSQAGVLHGLRGESGRHVGRADDLFLRKRVRDRGTPIEPHHDRDNAEHDQDHSGGQAAPLEQALDNDAFCFLGLDSLSGCNRAHVLLQAL